MSRIGGLVPSHFSLILCYLRLLSLSADGFLTTRNVVFSYSFSPSSFKPWRLAWLELLPSRLALFRLTSSFGKESQLCSQSTYIPSLPPSFSDFLAISFRSSPTGYWRYCPRPDCHITLTIFRRAYPRISLGASPFMPPLVTAAPKYSQYFRFSFNLLSFIILGNGNSASCVMYKTPLGSRKDLLLSYVATNTLTALNSHHPIDGGNVNGSETPSVCRLVPVVNHSFLWARVAVN